MRYSFSLACITFAIVGIPLGITAQRRETSVGFALSLMVAASYIIFITYADCHQGEARLVPASPHVGSERDLSRRGRRAFLPPEPGSSLWRVILRRGIPRVFPSGRFGRGTGGSSLPESDMPRISQISS